MALQAEVVILEIDSSPSRRVNIVALVARKEVVFPVFALGEPARGFLVAFRAEVVVGGDCNEHAVASAIADMQVSGAVAGFAPHYGVAVLSDARPVQGIMAIMARQAGVNTYIPQGAARATQQRERRENDDQSAHSRQYE